ncbi:MAG: hypothetical protein DDG60_09325 [Anaerolineae bacterium]|nr:MAG: hypothetical protein DDG60_09325 [Anaerolineae bacterium]
MSYTPLIWPLITSAAILFGIAISMRRYRRLPAAYAFRLFCLLGGLWSVTYTFNLVTVELHPKLIISQIQSAVSSFLAPAVFVFIIEYTGHSNWLNRSHLTWLLLIPSITALAALTSTHHSLFRYNFTVEIANGLPILESDRGPFYWLQQSYSIAVVVAASLIVILAFHKRPQYFRNMLIFLAGLIIPALVHLLYLGKILPLRGLQLTPFTMVFTSLIYLYALRGTLLFEVAPLHAKLC